ncbi:adenylate kinase [Paenibacillus rhizovicinus]|uniref:Adenylate kinase n=1 Tax=Paenibacillus rhizovicinus TaxID=2704463 RepID=A0A6C0NVF7_9BACL|nr:adenylate kinase [Paenibacillus rhizovicinus]QHW30128.1 adenylate kinase [Paenibacillus rhizovicinus]
MNIVLLGLPGSGKGTQAARITQELNIPHISTGDLLRKAYKEQTALGLLAHTYMSKGELVPDEVTIGIAFERLKRADCNNGFLLDGFPRNLFQAEALKKQLASMSKKIDKAIYIWMDEQILLKRITGRRVCSNCDETYHVVNHPPKIDSQCDLCHAVLVQREDDQEVTVKERLRVNGELTGELASYYRGAGILHTIIGLKSINEVTKDILQALRK